MATSDPVLSSTFHLLTSASPGRVWAELTSAHPAGSYLPGLRPRTCWSTGAPVEWHGPADAAVLSGQVLFADPPMRLSVTVEDDSGTCTYLTWTVRSGAVGTGTVVRLDVEESDGAACCPSDLEEVWLPILQRLEGLLSA